MVRSSWGLGSGFSRQNLRPFQRSSAVPGGGCSSVQRLWKAIWFCLWSVKNFGRGILQSTMIARCQGGSFGFDQMWCRWRAWSLFIVLLLFIRGCWWRGVDVGVGIGMVRR